jgi:hypothetical protein
MRNRFVFYLIIFLFAPAFTTMAQYKTDNVCYINNGRIYFQLDKRWTAAQKHEVSLAFNLDSTLIEQAFEGKPSFVYDSTSWEVNRIDDNIAELSKPASKSQAIYKPNDVFLIDDNIFISPFQGLPIFGTPKKFGVNKFVKEPVVKYENGLAHFYLPGFQKAEQVVLSGSFNNWSTIELPMQKTSSGWEISLKLTPSQYQYKYIVDGRWINDPNNLLKERDGQNGYNSVFYCYNHVFELQGNEKARKVYVSGSFNGWKRKDMKMNKVAGGWKLPVYLEQGTHAYKFIIDGIWIPDPANRNTRADADGNMNSFLGIGDTMVFKLDGYTTAEKVILAGSFNNWSTNDLIMNKTAFGWELPYVIGNGNYEYKFIVDGQWMPDPENPVTTGSDNYTNSCISVRPNYTFSLKEFGDAQNVIVTGNFNGWREDSFKMTQKDGIWTYTLYLKPGKYIYKFIVDGRWLIDPANQYWEENREGTGNSVLWIKP